MIKCATLKYSVVNVLFFTSILYNICKGLSRGFWKFFEIFFIFIYSLYLFTSILYNTKRIKVYGFLSYFYGFFGTAADQLLAKIWLNRGRPRTPHLCAESLMTHAKPWGNPLEKKSMIIFSLHLYYISFSFVCQVILHKLYITCNWIFFWDFAKLVVWIFQPLTTIFSKIVKKDTTLCLHII